MNWMQTLGPTALLLIGGAVSWFIKRRYEELRLLQEKLREDRRKTYAEILEPYIMIFTGISGDSKLTDKAIKKVKSLEYRKTAFDLSLIGSDEAVRTYNALMQQFYRDDETGKQDPSLLMRSFGKVLIAIRKDLGNKKTKLNELDMLKAMIKDIDKLKT